jgi:hypothetical protein
MTATWPEAKFLAIEGVAHRRQHRQVGEGQSF